MLQMKDYKKFWLSSVAVHLHKLFYSKNATFRVNYMNGENPIYISQWKGRCVKNGTISWENAKASLATGVPAGV